MNWFKAKNLILISLVVLNILLMALIVVTNDKYVLSSQQVENMYQVLSSKYNIGIYAELPKKFEPMKEIEVINDGQNTSDYLYKTFLGEDKDVKIIEEEDKLIYKNEKMMLMTQSGDFVLEISDGLEEKRDAILKDFQSVSGDFFLYTKYTIDNTTYYDYRQKYKDQTIYTNYLIFEERDEKVVRIEGYFARPTGFIGDVRDIVSVDMALFQFANFYPKEEGQQLFIDSIDLVYNQEQVVNEPDVALKATPCYLIKVRGNLVPVKIDAYTNTVLTK